MKAKASDAACLSIESLNFASSIVLRGILKTGLKIGIKNDDPTIVNSTFSIQDSMLKELVDEKFTLTETFKIKKKYDYSLKYDGITPIFLVA